LRILLRGLFFRAGTNVNMIYFSPSLFRLYCICRHDLMAAAAVTPESLVYAATWLGTGILSTNPNQVLLESNESFIDKFAIHALNRNVDMNWVSEMKVQLLKTVMAQETMTLTLAIDKRMVLQAIEEPEPNDAQGGGGFKAIILDGQHRWEAMKQVKEEMPNIHFKIWLIVYIVENDIEIVQRLETLNKRRMFSRADDEKVAVMKRFLHGFGAVHTQEYQSRRCIGKIRKSPVLRSEQFIKRHRTTTAEQFTEKIKEIANAYQEIWEAARNHTNPTLNLTIQNTGLYQLIDTSCSWLEKI